MVGLQQSSHRGRRREAHEVVIWPGLTSERSDDVGVGGEFLGRGDASKQVVAA